MLKKLYFVWYIFNHCGYTNIFSFSGFCCTRLKINRQIGFGLWMSHHKSNVHLKQEPNNARSIVIVQPWWIFNSSRDYIELNTIFSIFDFMFCQGLVLPQFMMRLWSIWSVWPQYENWIDYMGNQKRKRVTHVIPLI